MKGFPRSIAYICADPGVPVFGTKGCSVHVQEVVRTFLKSGARVTLFAQRIGGKAPEDLQHIPVIQLPKLDKSSIESRELSALANNALLSEMLSEEGPFDMVYERYSLWSMSGMKYAKFYQISGILEVNAPLIEEQKKHRHLVHEEEAQEVLRSVLQDASALVAVSDAIGNYLSKIPLASGKTYIIPNGVDPNRFIPSPTSFITDKREAFTVGFVGTLKPWHGVLDLVDAFALLHGQVPESRLLLVGDGPEKSLIEARLVAHGLTMTTHFTGAVHPQEVPALIATMDVCVAPYPLLDNFYFSPLKAFEYMAAGKAFVGSKSGQLSSIIDHEVDGLLYQPGNIKQLATQLVRLSSNPHLRTRLGRAARTKILTHHTWDAVGRQILQIADNQRYCEVV